MNLEFNDKHHEQLAQIFKLLGDAGRLRIVLACMDKPQPVCYLAKTASMSQSLTSHHLKNLRDARILKSERKGKQVLYSLDDEHIKSMLTDMTSHVQEGVSNENPLK